MFRKSLLSLVGASLLVGFLAFAGGDSPFPIRMAVKKTWVSQSEKRPVVIRLEIFTTNTSGNSLVGVLVYDLRTQVLLQTGRGVLKKDAPFFVAKMMDQQGDTSFMRFTMREDEKTHQYEMVIQIRKEGEKEVSEVILNQRN